MNNDRNKFLKPAVTQILERVLGGLRRSKSLTSGEIKNMRRVGDLSLSNNESSDINIHNTNGLK